MESKQVKDLLEAYSSIYEKKHEPEMEEGEMEEGEMEEGGKHKEGKHKKGKEEKGEKVTEKEDEETEKEMKESADLFDYILEHLVAEGYADTNKAALAIMANMSEEWKQSIVEGMFDFLPKQRVSTAPANQPADKRNLLQKAVDATKPLYSGLPKNKVVVPAKPARSREFTNPPS